MDKFNEIASDLDTGNQTDFDYRFYLKVLKSKQLCLPHSTACAFFKGLTDERGEDANLPAKFDALIAEVTSGPCVIAVLENLDGSTVSKLKEAMEPLKKKHGDGFHCFEPWQSQQYVPDLTMFPVHQSMATTAGSWRRTARSVPMGLARGGIYGGAAKTPRV